MQRQRRRQRRQQRHRLSSRSLECLKSHLLMMGNTAWGLELASIFAFALASLSWSGSPGRFAVPCDLRRVTVSVSRRVPRVTWIFRRAELGCRAEVYQRRRPLIFRGLVYTPEYKFTSVIKVGAETTKRRDAEMEIARFPQRTMNNNLLLK